MADILELIGTCGSVNPPGVKIKSYWVCAEDVDTFPGYLLTTGAGDTVTLDGDIVLTALKAFKQIDLLTDSGEVKDELVGNIGSKAFESFLDFMISTTSAAVSEFFELAANACFIVLVETKADDVRVFGNVDVPARMEAASSASGKTTGDNNAWTGQLKSTTGRVAPYYTGVIDLDPLT